MVSRLGCLVSLALVVACGKSDSGSPSGPSPTPGAATITITSSGVSPNTVTISAGSRVTFVNNDTTSHNMASDPHPEHSECPAINDVGFLQAGQSRTTGNLNTPRRCGFHDHDRSTNRALQGAIVVQ